MVILVVDDHADSLETMSLLLEFEGHEVLKASTGPKAVELAVKHSPRVALLDIGLPGMSGYDTCAAIRSQGVCDTIFIAITGYDREEDRQRLQAAGFYAHLVKPVDWLQLKQLLQPLQQAANERD